MSPWHQFEVHTVVVVASSPFFKKLLKRSKHAHPLIYMKGMKSEDILAIVDFLYYGEASIYQENLDTFLNIAEELELNGQKGDGEKSPENKYCKKAVACEKMYQSSLNYMLRTIKVPVWQWLFRIRNFLEN